MGVSVKCTSCQAIYPSGHHPWCGSPFAEAVKHYAQGIRSASLKEAISIIQKHLPDELPADSPDVLRLVEGVEAGYAAVRKAADSP